MCGRYYIDEDLSGPVHERMLLILEKEEVEKWIYDPVETKVIKIIDNV